MLFITSIETFNIKRFMFLRHQTIIKPLSNHQHMLAHQKLAAIPVVSLYSGIVTCPYLCSVTTEAGEGRGRGLILAALPRSSSSQCSQDSRGDGTTATETRLVT